MPTGLIRIHNQGDMHFITFSCLERRPYLNTPAMRDLVEDGLERTRKRHDFFVFGYVVMPEHVHVLLSEPRHGSVADVMKGWKLSVTLRQPRRPFWEERYYDFNVFTYRKYREKLKYIHRNPVRRGLVESPDQWPWSTFGYYSTGIGRGVEIESEWTAHQRRLEIYPPGSENPDPGHPSQ